jgi:hypothetical protein
VYLGEPIGESVIRGRIPEQSRVPVLTGPLSLSATPHLWSPQKLWDMG